MASHRALSFAGTSLVRYNGDGTPQLLCRIVRGLNETPEVRGSDYILPSVAGRVPLNRVADRRVITVHCHVFGSGTGQTAQETNFQDLADELQTLFDPTQVPAVLSAEKRDGTTVTIDARPLPGIMYADHSTRSYDELSVEFESVDPNWA